MKKRYHSAIKFLAGTLAAAVLCCMVSVSAVKPQKVQAADPAPSPTPVAPSPESTSTFLLTTSDVTLPVGGSFQVRAITNGTVEWDLRCSDDQLFKDSKASGNSFNIVVNKDADVVSSGAIKSGILRATTVDGATATCSITVNPKISSPIATPGTPSTPVTPTPSTPTPTPTPTPSTEPVTPTPTPTPSEPDNPPTPGEATAPPENTVITGVTIQDDTVMKDGQIVSNAIVQDANGTKYITDGAGKKITNQIVTAKDGTMYGTSDDGSVPVSDTFYLDGKKYLANADGSIVVSKFGTTPRGNKVYASADGSLVQKQLFKVDGKRYYAKKSGCVVRNKWVRVGTKKYYCNANGVITKTKKVS